MNKKGFIQIPNYIFDKTISSDLTRAEAKIVDLIIRKTYGFQKRQAKLSSGYIASVTGLSRRGVIEAVKKLRRLSIILKVNTTNRRDISIYELNTDVDRWGVDDVDKPVEVDASETTLKYAISLEHYKTFPSHNVLKKFYITQDDFIDIATEFQEYVKANGKDYVDYSAQLRRWFIYGCKGNKFSKRVIYERYT